MNVSWSDWKVRQGRAYSVTLPPACGRRQGYRIMPCPFGLSSHSRRPSFYGTAFFDGRRPFLMAALHFIVNFMFK